MKPKGKEVDEFSQNEIYEVCNRFFGGIDNVPPVALDMRFPGGLIYFNEPEYVNEFYITKNKFFDKVTRMKPILKELFEESILFDRSTKLQSTKRKHISQAFYKEKMVKMLSSITKLTQKRVNEWKMKYVETGN